jgi:hypothetical protein
MLKIKWTDGVRKDEVFQRAKEGRLLLKILQDRRHSWIGHTIRHNVFVKDDTKKRELLKNPTIIEEIQQKNFIDIN